MCGFPTSCLEIQLLALVGLDVMVISLHKKSVQEEFFVLSNSCKCSLRGGLRPLKKRRRAANQIVCTLSSNCDNHKSICIFFLFMIMLWNILNQPVDKSYLQEINSNRTSIESLNAWPWSPPVLELEIYIGQPGSKGTWRNWFGGWQASSSPNHLQQDISYLCQHV